MIIVTGSYGRLCNQIFLHAHLMAFGIEHGVTIVNPCFTDHSDCFEGTAGNPLNSYPRKHFGLTASSGARRVYYRLARLLYRAGRLFKTELVGVGRVNLEHLSYRVYPESPQDSSPQLSGCTDKLKGEVCLFAGWYFRCIEALRKHEQEISAFFTPLPAIRKQVERFQESLARHRCRIGVHVRHGDYADSGYYYPIAQYRSWIDQVRATAGPDVCFVISTDTSEDLRPLLQDDVHLCPGHPLVDLYGLAACDFIMGPPSTFNRWAAFYGKTKLLTLTALDQQIAFEDFRDLRFREKGLTLEDLSPGERELLDFGGVV